MQLISVGGVLLNLDQIAVMDMDRTQTGAVLRVFCDSPQPVIELDVPLQTVNALFNMVAQNQRFAGKERD